jgi:hypothetical protein
MTKVRALVRSDQRLTVRMIGSELNLNHKYYDARSEKHQIERLVCLCVRGLQKNRFVDHGPEDRSLSGSLIL